MTVIVHDNGLDTAAEHLAHDLGDTNRLRHLASTASRKNFNDREGDDSEVGQHAAPGDVLEVATDHASKVSVVAVRHLPPARDTGLDGQALQVELRVLLDLARQRRTRAHDGHLAQEDVDELRKLVDRVLADELADLGDAGVFLHLEHRAGDLVLLLELGQALVGVLVHGAELPHAEGREAAVAVGLTHADLAVERVALALQADGRGEHQARHGNHGEHAPAEADVERAFDKAVAQTRAVPILDVLHRAETLGVGIMLHGLRHK